jgi:TolA-binding protein
VYSDPEVIDYITRNFVPVRAHVKDNHEAFQQLGARFDAHWTPTTLLIDPNGAERHRIEGFLPKDDFVGQLALGRAKAAFDAKEYRTAESLVREVMTAHPNSDAAPEAQYWTGVSKYRATNDPAALKETGQAFKERYQDSTWAKKASIWQ